MNHYAYDGSFEGLLCVLARTLGAGETPASIGVDTAESQGGLFGRVVSIETNAALAARARRALETRTDAPAVGKLYRAFLSEQPDVEMTLFRLARAVVERGRDALDDLRFEPAFRVVRLAQQVGREVHRMHAFVRFEEHADGRYVALVEPDFNVLPLLGEHFAARYPAQRWAIADVRRRYALVHDAGGTRFAPLGADGLEPQAEREEAYQRMWQTYFHAVTIPERANPKLHLRHVPRRYWAYLTEKRGAARRGGRDVAADAEAHD